MCSLSWLGGGGGEDGIIEHAIKTPCLHPSSIPYGPQLGQVGSQLSLTGAHFGNAAWAQSFQQHDIASAPVGPYAPNPKSSQALNSFDEIFKYDYVQHSGCIE